MYDSALSARKSAWCRLLNRPFVLRPRLTSYTICRSPISRRGASAGPSVQRRCAATTEHHQPQWREAIRDHREATRNHEFEERGGIQSYTRVLVDGFSERDDIAPTSSEANHDQEAAGSSAGYPVPITPSELLIQALREAGHESCIPKHAFRKHDLTFANVRDPSVDQVMRGRRDLMSKISKAPRHINHVFQVIAQLFQACAKDDSLEERIMQSRELSKDDSKRIFSIEALAYLSEKGFTVHNVASWARILASAKAEDAALRLYSRAIATSDPLRYKQNEARIPLLLFLLRRDDITAYALRLLLRLAWNFVQNQHDAPRHFQLEDSRLDQGNKHRPWERSHQYAGNYPELDQGTFTILVVRLFRHARIVWPEILPNVAELLATFESKYQGGLLVNPPPTTETVFWYNRMLRLISLETREEPLIATQYRQQAQLAVLRTMSQFQPPVMINREGYRAVIRVQLAHRKTVEERDWALLKAKSWPPWKEDKLGADEEKGADDGISRAKSTLMRLSEAGYAQGHWEQAASILSGWDTDNSPTIQTRTTFNPSLSPTEHRINPNYGNQDALPVNNKENLQEPERVSLGPESSSSIWAARIRATRTIDEAWACFLAYREGSAQWTSDACFAMYEKLVMVRLGKLAREGQVEQNVVPGDTTELWPTSENPRERPYLRMPPPDEHQFIDEARARGVPFSGRFLTFMVSHAETMATGIQYIKISSIPEAYKEILLGKKFEAKTRLASKYHPLLAAYIRLLCRFAGDAPYRRRARITEGDTEPFQIVKAGPGAALPFAHALITQQKIMYRPAWYSLMAALARKRSVAKTWSKSFPKSDHLGHDMAAWQSIFDLCEEMRKMSLALDFDGFLTLCIALEKAVVAAHKTMARRSDRQADLILTNSVDWLKALFLEMSVGPGTSPTRDKASLPRAESNTSTTANSESMRAKEQSMTKPSLLDETMERMKDDPTNSTFHESGLIDQTHWNPAAIMPTLIKVPNPPQLHAFMRVLGFAHDENGIVDLLRWMAFFAPEIQARSNQLRNGQRVTRRIIVCARVMLERWWEVSPDPGQRDQRAEFDSERDVAATPLQEAQAVIEKVEDWGGWPTDEECEEYTTRGKRTN